MPERDLLPVGMISRLKTNLALHFHSVCCTVAGGKCVGREEGGGGGGGGDRERKV